ncbi:DUF2235 domain-containing protein [Apibacter sp. HY039]|uniref:T6SS phospholipase effector Tle1-like catalytic domain-containing protein n=1 Tax=Apibacter sp. HY039 TaxID=2501476 RepID=UPI0013E31321|nr:DUF2235 domain-containing protein [Apibacter sp. HY039]
MGKTFVYNTGEAKSLAGTLQISYGMFFDGTLNNRRNTEIRKKVHKIEEYKNQAATKEEQKIYQKKSKEDNSFANDFSNVARKSLCCKESYTIYTEGIGTTDEKGDSTAGFAWGRGETGVLAKVKSGCEKLAKKIKEKKENNDKAKYISIIVDIFGFSRGAAAARNFAHNLQKKAYTPEIYSIYGEYNQSYPIDYNGIPIDKSWLKDGKLPPGGDLGIALLKAGLDRELIEAMEIRVRFLGVYDTVASYDPYNLIPDFKKYIKKLHLNELGAPRKAVHFTAMDEHRENFSLTPMHIGITKEFPGVHSDIGGSYNTETEIVEELETSWSLKSKLEPFRKKLISEYWYKDQQLEYTGGFFYWALQGTRELQKEYSYIPLHFMGTYFTETLLAEAPSLLIKSLETEYPIHNNSTLVNAKAYLEPYVFNKGGKKWEFISDEELKLRKLFSDLEAGIKQTLEKISEQATVEPSPETVPEEPIYNGADLEEIIIDGINPQQLLRTLRNEYLHWSAKREGVGMDPNSDRKRQQF